MPSEYGDVELHHILGAFGAENVMKFSLFLYKPPYIYMDPNTFGF